MALGRHLDSFLRSVWTNRHKRDKTRRNTSISNPLSSPPPPNATHSQAHGFIPRHYAQVPGQPGVSIHPLSLSATAPYRATTRTSASTPNPSPAGRVPTPSEPAPQLPSPPVQSPGRIPPGPSVEDRTSYPSAARKTGVGSGERANMVTFTSKRGNSGISVEEALRWD